MPRKKAESKTVAKTALKTVRKTATRKKSSPKEAAKATKAAAKTATKSSTKSAAKTATKTTTKTAAKTAAKSPAKAASKTSTKAAPKAGSRPGRRTRTKSSATKAATKTAAPKVEEVVQASDQSAVEVAEGTPLTGKELVKKVKELGNNLTKEEKAKACGYYAMTKNGLERVNMMKFLNALIDAEGIDLDGKSGDSNGRGGRSASYKITVQSNGNLLIGAAYTKQMDLKPGDEFRITLGRKHIRLTQVDAEDE